MVVVKICCRCKKELDRDRDFNKHKLKKDGFHYECKNCERKYNLEKSNLPSTRYRVYKNHAKEKKRDFNISLEEFKQLTEQKCYYCNCYSLNKEYCRN